MRAQQAACGSINLSTSGRRYADLHARGLVEMGAEGQPIRFEVPSEQADTWLLYFQAECQRREWTSSSFGQIDRAENSG